VVPLTGPKLSNKGNRFDIIKVGAIALGTSALMAYREASLNVMPSMISQRRLFFPKTVDAVGNE
jgi:hypothetical protein